ncbi:hypothetical protein TIFTF001_032953 [Ficus carica]|uniref:Uncharacterized protein n=1 Tax=Ficus carica TaxID=3494 RepID=A0AA88J321_FICCA|nr:hypothetical protein TIFTF001_032953 [Ficus carica]
MRQDLLCHSPGQSSEDIRLDVLGTRYPGIQVAQALDLSVGGFDLVHRENGCHSDRSRGFSAYFVHRLHVAFSRPFLVSPKDADSTPTPSILSLENVSMNIMSAELPLSTRTRWMTLSATRISPINASLCGWSSRSASSSVKVIRILSIDRRCSAARPGWGNYSHYKLPQVTILDQQLNLVSKLYAVLRVMAHILVEVAVLVLVSLSTICPDWRWVSEQSSTRHLVKDVLDGCDQRGVLLEPSRQCSRTKIEIGSGAPDHGLPLFWSTLVRLVRLPRGKLGLFSGYKPSPSNVLVGFGMPPGDPPQVRKGGWLVVGKRPDEAGVFDAFPEGLY